MISSNQCWGVNWQIPLCGNTFQLHLVLIGSHSGLRWLVLNSMLHIPFPSCSLGLNVWIPILLHPCGLGWNITVEKQLFNASLSQGICIKGWLAKWFGGKCTVLVACKPIQGQAGPSKQQSLNNDLLQWAWKLPQLAAFITHQAQQTAFCFILCFPCFTSSWCQSDCLLSAI